MAIHDLDLDVRSEPPPRRHALIFDTYERPQPARDSCSSTTTTPSWDYLEEGPDVWRVRIGRTD